MIKSLRIQNFKAYRDQLFSLAPLTLLAGLNGSGKSSLIQALLVLRQSFDQGVLQQGRVAFNGDLVRLGRFQEALFESADEKRICISLVDRFGLRYECALDSWESDERTGPVKSTTPPSEKLTLFGPGFRFLGAERIGPRTQYSVPDNEGLNEGVGSLGEWTPFYLSKYGDRPARNQGTFHPKARSSEVKHQVEAWMGEVSPGIQIHYDRADMLDAVQMSYSFVARHDTSSRYRPTNVGFGVSYTLPVVTLVVSAQPGDLLLLESPEAHLHPRGQAKLGELLSRAAASGVQIIVESHSDHVMNGIRVALHDEILRAEDARFFYFCWDASDQTGATKVESITMNQDGRMDHWPTGFFDELDTSLGILLTPRAK